jgi:hypothetical protein
MRAFFFSAFGPDKASRFLRRCAPTGLSDQLLRFRSLFRPKRNILQDFVFNVSDQHGRDDGDGPEHLTEGQICFAATVQKIDRVFGLARAGLNRIGVEKVADIFMISRAYILASGRCRVRLTSSS